MTGIKNLVLVLSATSLSHIEINSFQLGQDFEVNQSGKDVYPLFFLEYPFSIHKKRNTSTVQIAFNLFDRALNSKESELNTLDKVERVLSEVIEKIKIDYKAEFDLSDEINFLTIHESFGDQVHGIRAEVEVTIPSTTNYCDLNSKFE